MACCGGRQKFDNPDNEQKWDYINLSDFHSTSCFTPLSYGVLYILALISIAVYVVDLFTCINLLFFDKWSGQVKPAIPFEISRWIFTACILLSYVLLVYRWWRAIRAMKSGVVAASYLDPLAVMVQSLRMGAKGRGWRRFLVFAALTKGRKGAEYVALFTYFSFEAWLRICFAEGPRQVINALTLYSVMQADLVPTGQHAAKKGDSPVGQFFANISILASKNREQVAILFGMLFTLVIWIFSALGLLMAIIFYITFLWHHIRDGSLSRYCRRKIDKRLHKIVMIRVNRALEKDNKTRTKQTAKRMRDGVPQGDFKRQPTVPILNTEPSQEINPVPSHTTEQGRSSLGSRSSSNGNPATFIHREPTIPNVFTNVGRPNAPSRSTTQTSALSSISYAEDAPLISSAAPLGDNHLRSDRAPPGINSRSIAPSFGGPGRDVIGDAQGMRHQPAFPSTRTGPPASQGVGVNGAGARFLPSQLPQARNPNSSGRPVYPAGPPRGQSNVDHRSVREYEMQTRSLSDGPNRRAPHNTGYIAFNPHNQGRRNAPLAGPPPGRNFTQPQRPPPMDYFNSEPRPPQRSGTAPIPQGPSNNDELYEAYGGSWHGPPRNPLPPRPATAGPNGPGGMRAPVYPRY